MEDNVWQSQQEVVAIGCLLFQSKMTLNCVPKCYFLALLLWHSSTSVYNVLFCKRLMSKVRQLNSYFFLAAFVISLYNLFLTVHLGLLCLVSRIIRKNLLNSFLSLLDSNRVTSYSYLWAENITFLTLRIFGVLLHFSSSNWFFFLSVFVGLLLFHVSVTVLVFKYHTQWDFLPTEGRNY